MKRSAAVVASAVTTLAFGFSSMARPVALVGNGDEVSALVYEVANKNLVETDCKLSGQGGLRPERYCDYSAVILLPSAAPWRTSRDCTEVKNYLASGGILVLGGTTSAAFSAQSAEARQIVSDARTIRLSTTPYGIRCLYASEGKSLGEADDRGVFSLSPEGEAVAAVDREYAKVMLGAPDVTRLEQSNEWATRPLGAKGEPLSKRTSFPQRPELKDRPAHERSGLILCDATRQAVLVASKRDGEAQALAREVAWHLGEMTGREFLITNTCPVSGPTIVITRLKAPRGVSRISRDGERLEVSGEGPGLSYAVTCFLESLGCRYLWPGKTGKVIPRKDVLIAPERTLDYVPAFKVREIRDLAGLSARLKDHPGNRGFWAWHGINDRRDLDGTVQWGHYFGNYWQRYGKDHPDWFALQANGSREQHLGNRAERPQLCLSSEGLAEETSRNIIAAFRRNPLLKAHSLCLPDGGYMSECMCEACRALDPCNASPMRFLVRDPWNREFDYVSLTDRVLTFANRVAERVTREIPEAKLTTYVYSNYFEVPYRVKPHPALILLSVAGSWIDPTEAERNVAAWSYFGNQMLWRPNVLWGYSAAVPMNYAREMYDTASVFAANGVLGVDFDNMFDNWASRGLIYYATARACRNPLGLSYEAVFDDYCKKGFGKAAPCVKRYFETLERVLAESRSVSAREAETRYVASLDCAAFEGMLGEGRRLAADEPEVLARLDLLARAWPYAREEAKVLASRASGNPVRFSAALAEFDEFLSKASEDPLLYVHKKFTSVYFAPAHRRQLRPWEVKPAVPLPVRVAVEGLGFTNELFRADGQTWTNGTTRLKLESTGEVSLGAPDLRLITLRMSWAADYPLSSRYFVDAWERTNGTSGWRGGADFVCSPWFTLVRRPDGAVDGYGVRVQPHSLVLWSRGDGVMSAKFDISAGGRPLNLGVRRLDVATLVFRCGVPGESAFAAGREFCRAMCPVSRLPKRPVYGYNDWYCAYGKNTATNFLSDAAFVCSLAAGLENRPYVVMDDGWQPNSPPVVKAYKANAAGGSGYGPWDRSGEAFGMEMGEFAARVKALGSIPGLWYRPYRAWPDSPQELRAAYDPLAFDPTLPHVRESIVEDLKRFRTWGFGLVKIDYLTKDLCGIYEGQMGDCVFQNDRGWADDSRTSAEVMLDLHRAMREAAGDDVVLIGCNALNHLVAGLFELQRTGNDTSGWKWERTRDFGVNTLGARAIQDGIFFAVDSDCVGLARAGAIPWEKNGQWLDLVSRSGTPLFISWHRSLVDEEIRGALMRAFATASRPRPVAEPVDWLLNPLPKVWRFGDGTKGIYEW